LRYCPVKISTLIQ